jgi:5'-3' exonuclease
MTAVAAEAPRPRVVLIDLSSLFHPAWRSNENGPLSVAFAATIEDVTKCAKRDPSALVAICIDSRKSWRKDLVPSYKAQREKLGNDFYDTLDRVKERLRADGYLLWEADGFEADDVIATATEEAVKRGHDVAICSADKDMFQLLRPGVKQLRTHDWSIWGVKEAEEKFGVKVSQIGDALALMGDTSDNIKGCKDVGPKRAAQMLTTNGDWPGIVKALEAKSFTPAITAALQGFDFDTARKLVGLRTDVPIKFDDIYQERAVKPLVAVEEPLEEKPAGELPVIVDDHVFTYHDASQRTFHPWNTCSTCQGPYNNHVRTPKDSGSSLPPDGRPLASDTVAIQGLVEMPQPANETKALATSPANPQLQPGSVGDAYSLAKLMLNSRLYTKFGNAEAILACMIRGRELGFQVMTALDAFHVIEGKPCLTSAAIQALAESLPDCEYLICTHTDDKSATWETKHRKHPKPTTLTYTRAEAVQAGLCSLEPAPNTAKPGEKDRRSNWDKRGPNMIRKTCRDNLLRMVYPSAGFMYSVSEMGGDEND